MKHPRFTLVALTVLALGAPASAAETKLPLPDAPVMLVIPDARAFDAALGGGFRKALAGTLPATDPAGAAWLRTRVGGKLETQWSLFAKDLPLTWTELMALRPASIGLGILSVGDLEAVLAVETAMAELPVPFRGGIEKQHSGVPYRVVSRGAGDDPTSSRRMGAAWARVKGFLLVATSERALQRAIDRALAGEGVAAFRPGLASVRLDQEALRKDLYFKREFLFLEGVNGPSRGIVTAALDIKDGNLVEEREGEGAEATPAASWSLEGRAVAAAGWESDGVRFFEALRRGFLEPLPEPAEHPVPALKPLPDATTLYDRYLVDLRKPAPSEEGKGEDGELPRWRELVKDAAVTGWGWEIAQSGARRLVFRLAPSMDARFAGLALATATRRAGLASVAAPAADTSAVTSLEVGPDLGGIAWKRTGDWVWLAADASALRDVVGPVDGKDLVRWSRLDVSAIRKDGKIWARAEGAFSPDQTRPFTDRILGLLGWAPDVTSVHTERRVSGERFTERVVFEGKGTGKTATR